MFTRHDKLNLFIFAFVIAIFVFQTYRYKEFALEATVLMIKEKINLTQYSELKRLGAITNTLGQFETSVKIFEKLYQQNPSDVEVLSNLALSLTFTSRYKEAQPFYRAYFSSGGTALDVMYWYGKALKATGDDEEAIYWFYNLLYYRPSDILSAREIVSSLFTKNKITEALSFLGSLVYQNKDDESNELLLSELQRFEKLSSREVATVARNPQENEFIEEHNLPSLNGTNYFLPFKSKKGEYYFLKVDKTQSFSTLSEVDIEGLGWPLKKMSDTVSLVEEAYIGDFKVLNFQVRQCAHCISVIGIDFLKTIKAREDRKGKLSFLVLNQD